MQITIASGKGGTGKTTLATGLARYLSESGKVILADLDVEEPNAGLFISGERIHRENTYRMVPEWLSHKCKLSGNCQEVCNFNAIMQLHTQILVFPELCHSCHACAGLCPSAALKMIPMKTGELTHSRNNNLDFIEGRMDVGQEQAIPVISETIRYVNEHFPANLIRIYDAPPGTSCPVIEATKNADFVILVTEPTPFGYHDLELAVETVRALNRKFAVVINRDGNGFDQVDNFCKSENIDILARIPVSRKVAELYSRGSIDYTFIPEFRQALENIITFFPDLHHAIPQ